MSLCLDTMPSPTGTIALSAQVLDNFWPAIEWGDLVVHAGDLVVNKKNLASLLEMYRQENKSFTADRYHRAYTSKDSTVHDKELPIAKKCTVKLLACEEGTNKVAMVRSTGMVIYQRRTNSPISYAGVFECRNDTGNGILRRSEPPQHNAWDPDRPEPGKSRKILKEINEFVIESVKSLTPAVTGTVVDIPELSKFLPDDSDDPSETFDEQPGAVHKKSTDKTESFDNQPLPKKIVARNVGIKPATAPGGQSPGDGDGELEIEPEDEGEGSEGGGGGGQSGGVDGGVKDGDKGRTPLAVSSRAVSRDAIGKDYLLIVPSPPVRPTRPVYVSLAGIGDDSTASLLKIASASAGTKSLAILAGKIGPVTFPPKGPLRINLTLEQPRRVALSVGAYEEADDANE
jgi:hypothetical protein